MFRTKGKFRKPRHVLVWKPEKRWMVARLEKKGKGKFPLKIFWHALIKNFFSVRISSLTLRDTVKLTFVFLKNMHKYVTVKSCIFCSKLQYSDDHHFVNKKSACTYWGNFVFYIQKMVIWTNWCFFYVFRLQLHFFRRILKKV